MKQKLKDICEGITDGSHNPPSGGPASDFIMISSKNVFDDCITYDEPRFLTEEQFNIENKRTNITSGDILMTIVGTVGRTAVVNSNTRKITLQRSVAVLHPNKKICNSRFLMYSLRSKRKYFESEAHGVAQKGIYLKQLSEIYLNIPEKKRQNNIVQILDNVCDIIMLRKQQLQQLDDLIKARFVEMFGDPENGNIQYPTFKLKDLSTKISDGVHAKPEYKETGRPFLSVVNINKKKVDFTDCKYVSEEAYQKMIKSTHPERGDVLYTKVGATYGIPAYVDTDVEFCLYVSVCLIKPIHNKINSRFLALQMDMPFIKHQADKRIKGIGVPDLHLNQISDFDIVCPPREKQDAFISFVEQVDKSKAVVQKALDEAQLLFDSLMQQYFG